MVLLERNSYGHPSAGLLWERQFEEALFELGWEKVPNWEFMFAHRKQRSFRSVYVDDIKTTGKKQNVAPMCKKLMKKPLILENLHHLLTMSTWDALNVNANQMKRLLNEIQRCLNHAFLLQQMKNYRFVKISRETCSVVLRHGGACSKMR